MRFRVRGRRRFVAPSMMISMGVVAAACGSTPATSSTTAAPEVQTTVNVGVLPIADVAPLYLGIKEGYFSKQKLTIVPQALQGGAAVASAVVGGSLDFGFGATANLILARENKLPLQFVAAGDSAASTAAQAWSGIMVSGSSGITSISQLAGKTIAVNATQGENELALDSVLLKHGVNPSSVHLVVLPFPTMVSALSSGQVQAVTEVEPFVAAITGQGGKLLSPLFEGMAPNLMVAGYFATTAEISSKAGVVKRFVTAMNESLNYAASHPSAVRAIIPTYTSIPATVASALRLPIWRSTIDTSTIQSQEKLMKQLGWITSNVTVRSLVWSGAAQ